jgi:hypothetical protein
MSEKTTITITGLSVEHVADQVAFRIMHDRDGDETRFSERIEAIVEERVREWVNGQIERLASIEIERAVAAVLEEGWQQTNQYGEATGKRMTLKERIAAMLQEPTGDAYSGGRKPRIDHVAHQLLNKALHESFGKEIEAGRGRLRAAIDDVIKAKLTETLKSALGLR